jgi:hypothetical protein
LLELRELGPADGRRVRGLLWAVAYLIGALLAVAGGVAWSLLAFLA